MNRREFLFASGALALGGCSNPSPLPDGALLGPNHTLGHRLRAGDLPEAREERRTRVLIVGGGVAGLSAAWWLQRAGLDDFALLDLEDEVGGNARFGESAVTAYPWGAHYLPLPTREAVDLRLMLADLGIITGTRADGSPVYDERLLAFPARERLFHLGKWQTGLEPRGPARSQQQFARFRAIVADYQQQTGRDGRPAFAIPSSQSSRDNRFTVLDRISMQAWLDDQGFDDPGLRWYVDYACRDDFGSRLANTSAWAGLHYFTARRPFGPYDDDQVLTAPEGNGFLVRRLEARLRMQLVRGEMAWRVRDGNREVIVDSFNGQRSLRWRAGQVILAVPLHVAARLLNVPLTPGIEHVPWLVANLHVEHLPHGLGTGPAWDNVLYDSEALGYVVATHQQLRQHVEASVLTYYWPLTGQPGAERQRLWSTPQPVWAQIILAELRRAHADIDRLVTRLDVWRWGHGMIAPRPGLIHGPALAAARLARGRLHMAHSDVAGMSLCEEAHDYGVRAARTALAALG